MKMKLELCIICWRTKNAGKKRSIDFPSFANKDGLFLQLVEVSNLKKDSNQVQCTYFQISQIKD